MKDTSRPNTTPSSRSAPYRKRKSSGNGSPTRGTRRPHDASQPQPPGYAREMIIPPDRAYSSHRDEAQTSRAALMDYSPEDERCALSRARGNRVISQTRRHISVDGSTRERAPQPSALSTHADVPGTSLRLPLTSAPPITNTLAGQGKATSPPPGSVTAFLRSIELPDNPSSAPAPQKSYSISTSPSPCLPPLSTDNTDKAESTNRNGYKVSLVYKGYPFTYDLSALQDDPNGTIALLNITKSNPGAYILVGAHYRRTGRPRAACAVIKSLFDSLDIPSEKGVGDAVSIPASATSTATLVSPGSPCSRPIDCTRPMFKSAAMRPAMLLLAACELDISREHPDDPQSASHASTAHELFRAVYGTVNDAIVAGAVRSQPKNALGLDFSRNKNGVPSIPPDSNGRPPRGPKPPPDAASLTRIKNLEKELSAARVAQNKLRERLTVSNGRVTRAEGKVHVLESRSREVRNQLDVSRDENWELRRQLADCEQRERELAQCVSGENRVWGRLKDLLFDNLGGGMRGV